MGGIHHPLSSILVATKSEIFKDDIEKIPTFIPVSKLLQGDDDKVEKC